MSTFTTIGTFKSGATLARVSADGEYTGRLCIILATPDPDHETKPKADPKTGAMRGGGNPAFTIGGSAWDTVREGAQKYTLTGFPQLVLTRDPTPAEKARARAEKLATDAAKALAEAEALEAETV